MSFRDTPELVTSAGIVIGWTCSQCEAYNDALTILCKTCSEQPRPDYIDETAILHQRGILGLVFMEDYKDIYTEFFNASCVKVADMDFEQLREWRGKMAKAAVQGKAGCAAADKRERELKAKMTLEGKAWLTSTGNDPNVTDAVETVKIRKERMSKADREFERYKKLGIDDELANQLIRNIEKAATSSNMPNSFKFNANTPKPVIVSELCRTEAHSICPGRFADDKGSHICNCECHNQANQPKPEPFDPSKLFG